MYLRYSLGKDRKPGHYAPSMSIFRITCLFVRLRRSMISFREEYLYILVCSLISPRHSGEKKLLLELVAHIGWIEFVQSYW